MSQPVRVKTPLRDDLLFRSLEWKDELSRLSSGVLDLLSPKEDIELDDMLAQAVTVEVDLANGDKRYFHGHVSQMTQTGREGDYFSYTAILRPWFWFFTQTADCRIFQEITVPDLVKDIFQESGFDFDDKLAGSYREWEYIVQYRETDFSFISRLLEQEGIYYYFRYEDGKDVLVMADSYSAHSLISGYEKIPYYPPTENVVRDECVSDWRLCRSVRTGAYALNAYHFKKPRADLKVLKSIARNHTKSDYEVFDYPGEYFEKSEGEVYAGARIEELQAQYERVQGETDVMGLFPGGLFELTEYPREDQNREYLVCSTEQNLDLGDYETGGKGKGLQFSCSFEAMYSQEQFRAARITPKPVVQGPQNAIVTGPSGDEIHTDEYGRVKVQFGWDRYGGSDENSSCWIRVAQIWAGSQWGGMAIPRIGQEVIVDFIEGDPDRPIVTGRVYNAVNMPPYELPANKTRSGIKSRSTLEGSAENFNEIRFEDKIGEEEMYIHAEKDQNIVVENNQTIKIGFEDQEQGDRTEAIYNDRSLDVGRDKSEKIGRNKKILVKADHHETIDKSMTVMVGSSLTESVATNYAETVGAAMELSVGGLLAVNVGAAMTETVGGAKSENVGAAKSESIGTNKSIEVGSTLNESIGKDRIVEIAGDYKAKVGGQSNVSIEKEYVVKAKVLQLVAQDEISIKSGKAQITMKKNGDITIKGNKVNVKGSGDVVIKGSKIKEN